jgi:hypothetical protein
MAEQRNPYKGSPPRPWVRLDLVSPNGHSLELRLLADTGNPFALIVGADTLLKFNFGFAPSLKTNFGTLDGGWLQVLVSSLGFNERVLGYGSDAVMQAAQSSHPDFDGLVGLPLLRMLEYGGDSN